MSGERTTPADRELLAGFRVGYADGSLLDTLPSTHQVSVNPLWDGSRLQILPAELQSDERLHHRQAIVVVALLFVGHPTVTMRYDQDDDVRLRDLLHDYPGDVVAG
mgnify:CR=1 FL=1